jgi:hypothetical protein
MADADVVLARNSAGCAGYHDRSFVGRLHEDGIWDWDEYWLLEKALYDLAAAGDFRREVAWPLFRIFSYGLLLFGCHVDPNDRFAFKAMSAEEVHELRDRFQRVFEGFFAGEMPARDAFAMRNPLLLRAGG